MTDASELHVGLDTWTKRHETWGEALEFAFSELRRAKDDVVHVIHVRLTTQGGDELADLDDLLRRMKFVPSLSCNSLKDQPCYAAAVPATFDLDAFIATATQLWSRLVDVREALAKSELTLPRLSVHLERGALGDGHANRRKSSRGDISDDVFKYALVWIEQEKARGWVIHYSQKTDLDEQLSSVLSFLGLERFDECPEFAMTPCLWRGIVTARDSTFYDERAAEINAAFQAHYRYFLPAVTTLLDIDKAALDLGFSFLPPPPSSVEAAQQAAGALTMNLVPFGFIRHAGLRAIATRDHRDLMSLLPLEGHLKAKVMLAGSVVEALMLDALVDQQGAIPEATTRLSLGQLVGEARRRGAALSDMVVRMAEVVVDFRNFSHPGVELRNQPLGQEDAEAAVALLNLALRERRGGDP